MSGPSRHEQPEGDRGAAAAWPWRTYVLVALAGVGAGFLAGLFGVGGGVVIVPALVAILGLDQRRAAATSLAAIVLIAALGVLSYLPDRQVSLPAAGILLIGSLVGAQLGSWLLRHLSESLLLIAFVTSAIGVIVTQQLMEPSRGTVLHLDPLRGAGLVAVGLAAGLLSGLVGVGGGSILVPGMEILVGVGDLMARGTSLLVIIPTALAGSWTNARHGLVDLRAAVLIGVGALAGTPGGTWVAGAVSPRVGNILFSLFLVVVVWSTVRRLRRTTR